jgi:hypothetical protein
LDVGKLVVKYLETVHANQTFSMLTALNNVQINAKVTTVTKMTGNVWSADMDIMGISVKKVVLETVKKDV